MIITPDLKQNIIYTVYLTIAHNAPAITYAVGAVLGSIYALYRPSRKAIFLLLGCMILLLSFEYNKHIEDGLKEQTVNSLITTQEHQKVRRAVTVTIDKLLPLGLSVLGWICIGSSAALHIKERGNKRKTKISLK